MAVMSGLLRRGAHVVGSWSPQERDAVLYAMAALFAICTAQASGIALYRQWGWLAFGPYTAGALLSAAAARAARRGRSPRAHWTPARAAIFLLVLLGATLVPLALEVLWRTDSQGTAHVQPEVVVVEHAGVRVERGQDPYQLVNPHHLPATAPGEPAYDAFNPYLPLMSLFGLARATHAPPRLTDARVAFSVITMLLVAVALALCRGPTEPRVLALQFMTVLPTAAMPLATGGDDMPVAALLLLGLVLVQRRRPFLGGVVLGVAASMKITAWPLAILAPVVARDRSGVSTRRARIAAAIGVAGVVAPAVLPSALANVPAFVENVVRFPLGLAGVSSPAASPLLGHLVVSSFPALRRGFTATVAVIGAAALAWVLVRRTPRSPAALARLLAWVATVAILLAPATRIGYLLYPVEFFVWAVLLRGEDMAEAGEPAVLDAVPTGMPPVGAAAGERRADPGAAPVGPPWAEVPSPAGATTGFGIRGARRRGRSPRRGERTGGRARTRQGRARTRLGTREPATGGRAQPASDTTKSRSVNGVAWVWEPAAKVVGAIVAPTSQYSPATDARRARIWKAPGEPDTAPADRTCQPAAGSWTRKNEITACSGAGTVKPSERS